MSHIVKAVLSLKRRIVEMKLRRIEFEPRHLADQIDRDLSLLLRLGLIEKTEDRYRVTKKYIEMDKDDICRLIDEAVEEERKNRPSILARLIKDQDWKEASD